ncbi:hypothetical protein HHK36_015159 [Tetracentron sinense]|uniref:WAT1-related protein n=1 Tax=Tetracentron sinense TaxID=13715 RepID=A0A834Z0A2_TETSI|nr:hypothetical protein HHK36_015159 [Tetracentron sinense]
MGVWSGFWEVLPFTALVMTECTNVGLNTIFKAAMFRGMNQIVFIVYSYALASLILLPSSFIFHRAASRPPLTFSLLCKIFLLSIIGCLMQFCGYTGINYSSPILASAIGNLVPAFTFILAIIFRFCSLLIIVKWVLLYSNESIIEINCVCVKSFSSLTQRMEKLDLRNSSSQAKSMGTIVSISGAFIVTLYKGPPILLTPSASNSNQQLLLSQQSNWVIGGIFLATEYFLYPVWYVFQASIVKEYPVELFLVFFYNFFVAILSAIVSQIIKTNPSAWRVRPDIELIAIVYSGPVYVAMFKPLAIVIAIVMGVMFLGDTLYLGSVVGAIIISIGFYAVMWGKTKEDEIGENSGPGSLESSSQKVPLLQSSKIEEI